MLKVGGRGTFELIENLRNFLGIGVANVHRIIHEAISMRKIGATFISKVLNRDRPQECCSHFWHSKICFL